MKFTKIPADAFEHIQLNAGILLKNFDPSSAEVEEDSILGATTGGMNFSATPSFTDFGEDIDNCPKNTKELKKLESWEIKLSGTLVTTDSGMTKMLVAVADVSGNHITPRNDLLSTDFTDIWWVGDYSDKNGNSNGGFIAIKVKNALNTGGFQLQSTDNGKGQFAFEFTGHYSMNQQSVVPFDVYVQAGTPETGEYAMTVESEEGSTSGKTAITVGQATGSGESYVYQTGYGLFVPDQGAVLAGSAWASWNGSAEIDGTTGMDIVVAIIDSESKAVHAGKTVIVAAE